MMTPRVSLVAHTHWDREWYLPFEVFRARLLEVLDEALELLEGDRRLSFTLDGQTALVDDYLELRPHAEQRIRALVQAGRLHVGPWFTQADTLLADGESLIRNLALGIRRAEELGGAMRIGYMPDQFGHAAQLPQIMRLFGIEAAILWRGVGPDRPPHAFRWTSPDGSAVVALWLQDGYATGRLIPSDPQGFAAAIERTLERLAPWLGEMPLLVPIGDDHVRLASWLPEAVEHLQKSRPDLRVAMGGYEQHMTYLRQRPGEPQQVPLQVIQGELRSPAFAPVLAGVASARITEKQAAERALRLLLRYAEPLCAWEALAERSRPGDGQGALQGEGPSARAGSDRESRNAALIDRAWRQLMLNQAHDSAAGCGADPTHADVKARYRWCEQLAATVRDQALSRLSVMVPGEGGAQVPATVVVFHPGPAEAALVVEAEVPRADLYGGAMHSLGPDGVPYPVQLLDTVVEDRPLFEGEFGPVELGMFIQGTDPATPLFGKYLTGIAIHDEGAGRLRLDVALGDAPVPRGALAADQRRVMGLLGEATRFRVVIHNSSTHAKVLLMAGPANEAALVPVMFSGGGRSGQQGPQPPDFAYALPGGAGIGVGPVRVVAQPDGTVLITDESLGFPAVVANDLVDEGDRGDLYHFDPVGPAGQGAAAAIRPHAARARVVQSGPLRARLVIEQELLLPVGLGEDRAARSATTVPVLVTTEVTVVAGQRRVEFSTALDNQVRDHRLRALCHAPLRAQRQDVGHGLAVSARPLDTTTLGSGVERPAATGPHHEFVDITDGLHGVALMSRGLPEHEVRPESEGLSVLALTLLRGVGWLARGDLACMDHAAGPIVPTPDAQELGPQRFEYALLLHRGDWVEGQVLEDSRRYLAPPLSFVPRGRAVVPGGVPLCEVTPAQVQISAVYPGQQGLVVRVLNASGQAAQAALRPARRVREVVRVDPLERPLNPPPPGLLYDGEAAHLALDPWQIATLLFRW